MVSSRVCYFKYHQILIEDMYDLVSYRERKIMTGTLHNTRATDSTRVYADLALHNFCEHIGMFPIMSTRNCSGRSSIVGLL